MMFPLLVYKADKNGAWPLAGHTALHKIASASNDAELAALVAAGWFVPCHDVAPDDDAPPTRDELVQKARELGIEFHHRTGDARLAAMIAEALAK